MAYEAAELARAEHKCADPLSAAVLEEVKQSERIMEVRRCRFIVCPIADRAPALSRGGI